MNWTELNCYRGLQSHSRWISNRQSVEMNGYVLSIIYTILLFVVKGCFKNEEYRNFDRCFHFDFRFKNESVLLIAFCERECRPREQVVKRNILMPGYCEVWPAIQTSNKNTQKFRNNCTEKILADHLQLRHPNDSTLPVLIITRHQQKLVPILKPDLLKNKLDWKSKKCHN